jgi:membrane-bound serine protease (ClpP class)
MHKKQLIWLNILVFLAMFLGGNFLPARAQTDAPTAVVISLEGPLTPVWSGYLKRGIDRAVDLNANLLVIELNTPGGSISLMNSLVEQILASPVPVVVYVSPNGGMAASAGTLLVLAGKAAAMAPETAIGAASPVGTQGEDIGTTEELKTKEILKASVRSLAKNRGPEAVALAESAIESARAASASEALEVGLVDYLARDVDDLLAQLDGRTVEMNGNELVLNTRNALLVPVATTPVEDVLGLLTNPNIVFLLLSVGVQAILIELSNPGGWFAGFIGAVLLALAIYGLGILPVNWFGLIFLVIAMVLFILDIKAPTHGALTAAGTASFIAGALILFNSVSTPGFSRVSVGLVIGVGLFMGLLFFAVVMIAVRAMKTPLISGKETLTGKTGLTVTKLEPRGIVQVAGEQWSGELAAGQTPIEVGERIVVERVEGVRLIVRKVSTDAK